MMTVQETQVTIKEVVETKEELLFELIKKSRIREQLGLCVKQYVADVNVIDKQEKNHRLLEETVKILLDVGDLDTQYPTVSQYAFQLMSQLKNKDGYVSDKPISLYAHPDELTNLIRQNNFVKLTGNEQTIFLLAQLYFLITLYIKVANKQLAELPVEETYRSDLLEALLREIGAAVNAYRIRVYYHNICDLEKMDENKEALLATFITQFLFSLQEMILGEELAEEDRLELGEEICFPCGTAGHAMYLNFVCLDNQLLLRLDNLGGLGLRNHHPDEDEKKVSPKLITLIDFTQIVDNKGLNNYLFKLCSAKYLSEKESRIALATIYNQDNYFNLPGIQIANSYEQIEKQDKDNCVVKAYLAGMLYRLSDVCNFANKADAKNAVFNWLVAEHVKYASVNDLDTNKVDELAKIHLHRIKSKSISTQNGPNTNNNNQAFSALGIVQLNADPKAKIKVKQSKTHKTDISYGSSKTFNKTDQEKVAYLANSLSKVIQSNPSQQDPKSQGKRPNTASLIGQANIRGGARLTYEYRESENSINIGSDSDSDSDQERTVKLPKQKK